LLYQNLLEQGKPFVFILCSGAIVVRLLSEFLWFWKGDSDTDSFYAVYLPGNLFWLYHHVL
jgi:hypothetical protein